MIPFRCHAMPSRMMMSLIAIGAALLPMHQSLVTSKDLEHDFELKNTDFISDVKKTAMLFKELEEEIYLPNIVAYQPTVDGQGKSMQLRNNPKKDTTRRNLKKAGKHTYYKSKTSKKKKKKKKHHYDHDDDDYYSHQLQNRTTCPDPHSNVLECAPDDLEQHCDKRSGDFRSCYMDCKPSFCCIHDSMSTSYSPSCSSEENCDQYSSCYIIWWKLHDTVGPANYLNVEQNDDFFNMDFGEFREDLIADTEFFAQLFGHHFDVDDAPADDKFEEIDNW